MKMTTRGRVTIPKQMREAMGLRGGSKLDFEYIGAGKAVMRKAATTPSIGTKAPPKRRAS